MTTRCSLRRRAIESFGIGLVLILNALPVRAQPTDDAFKEGLDARSDRKWQEAAAQMRRAIQANPKEDTRKVTRGIGRILGGGGTEYLPFYFLGEALFNLGDCSGAVEAWGTSEQQGVVRTRPDYVAVLQKGYATCETKGVMPPAKFMPVLARARQQVIDVTNLAASISAAGQAHSDLWHSTPSMREQYDRGNGELQNAQSRLATATRTRQERDFTDAIATAERARGIFKALESQLSAAISLNTTVEGLGREIDQLLKEGEANDRAIDGRKVILPAQLAASRQTAATTLARARSQLTAGSKSGNVQVLTEARSLAQDASNTLKQVLDELTKIERRAQETRFVEAVTQAQEAFSFVDGGFATVERLATEKPTSVPAALAAERDSLQTQVGTLRRRFEAAKRNRDVISLQEAARLATEVRARLDAIIGAFGPVTIIDRGVRPELAEGARLFFAGEYQQTLEWLDPAKLVEVPLQLHVHLFRAAALYALYVRSGETDQARRTQAIAEIDKCKQLNSTIQPDTRAFGPRFVRFFENPHAPSTPDPRTASQQQQP